MGAVELLALLPLGFWLLLLFDRRRRFPGELVLPSADADLGGLDEVVAIVPARDEAGLLPETLPSLLGPTESRLRVVLVDDDSTDGTAEVARRVARSHGAEDRLRVVPAPPRPAAWTGKLWALQTGVDEARGWQRDGLPPAWLLLTDADIHHRRGATAALLARATTAGDERDLVSIMARLVSDRFWEKLLMPAFLFFFHLLYPFRRVADPHSGVAAAAGGCVLVRADALSRAGGLAPISGALIDDVALARRIADSGGRLWLGLDPGIKSLRPYGDLAGVWRVVARSAFVQLRHRLSLALLAVGGLLLFAATPPLLIASGAIAHLAPLEAAPLSPARGALWALLAWALQAAALAPWVRHQRLAASYSWALPFAAFLYALMTAASAASGLRGTGAAWKGRRYRPTAATTGQPRPDAAEDR